MYPIVGKLQIHHSSYNRDMSVLFSPLKLRDLTFKNRIFVSPMCQYSCEEGMPTDWHLVHLGSRAVGGAAMVCVEATAVSPQGRISPADSGIWSDAHVEVFARIARFIREQGSIPAIQLAHAGAKRAPASPGSVADRSKNLAADGKRSPPAPSPLPPDTQRREK